MSTRGFSDLVEPKDGKNLWWTTDINCELPIKMGETGRAAEIKPESIPRCFARSAKLRGDCPALRVMRNNKELLWTWSQFYNDAVAFAKSLLKLGVSQRKAVNIMGFNAPEWVISACGSLMYNCVFSGVYITNAPDACQYQSEHSSAEVIVVDTLSLIHI